MGLFLLWACIIKINVNIRILHPQFYSINPQRLFYNPNSASPAAGELPFLSPPSDSGGGIAVDLALEVDRVVLHDHLIDRPSYQHRALYGGRRKGGRSARPFSSEDLPDHRPVLTVHHQLCWVTVPLSNHVFTHANIHSSISLSGVWNHQFASTHLKKIYKEEVTFNDKKTF